MSLFLGPIHKWVYNKVLNTEDIVIEVANFADLVGQNDTLKSVDDIRVRPLRGELEEIIDVSNIHGWLSEQVDRVEERFASVIAICINNNISISDLEKLFENIGARLYENMKVNTPKEAFQALKDYLLDGMPCDGGLFDITIDEDVVRWKLNLSIHTKYFLLEGIDIEAFVKLRDSLINGFIKNTDLKLIKTDLNSYEIRR